MCHLSARAAFLATDAGGMNVLDFVVFLAGILLILLSAHKAVIVLLSRVMLFAANGTDALRAAHLKISSNASMPSANRSITSVMLGLRGAFGLRCFGERLTFFDFLRGFVDDSLRKLLPDSAAVFTLAGFAIVFNCSRRLGGLISFAFALSTFAKALKSLH